MRLKPDERHACPEGKLICPLCGADQGYMTGSDADHIQERARWRCDVCHEWFDADVDRKVTFFIRLSTLTQRWGPAGRAQQAKDAAPAQEDAKR